MKRRAENGLHGYRIAVTAPRRAGEFCFLLRRYGATVSAAAPVELAGLPDDDDDLRHRTEALIAEPPDALIVTTAFGMRGWVAAADGWGRAEALITALSKTRVLACGQQVVGALRAAGLVEQCSVPAGSSGELLDHLLDTDREPARPGIAGGRVAVQLPGSTDDGAAMPELLTALRAAGADVATIRVHRWRPSAPAGEFDRLLSQLADQRFDAISFTSTLAVTATLKRADELGILDDVHEALQTDVHAMCVGPLTATPLARLGIPTSWPNRMRLAALARHIADELPRLSGRTIRTAGHRIDLHGGSVLVDGVVRPLPPTGMAMLRVLAHRPGAVVARDDLLRLLPGSGGNPHAVETAVGRLRSALGDKAIVVTVVKRGYRLAVDVHLDAA